MAKSNVFYFVNYPFRMTGANQVLFNLLESRKENSVVIFMFKGPAFDYFHNNGIQVHSLDYRPKWIGSFGKQIFRIKWHEIFTGLVPELVSLSYRLYKLTRSTSGYMDYRIIHFNDTRGLLTGGWFFKLFGYKIVTHIHGEFDANNVTGMRWRVAKFLSNRFITVSNYLRQKMDEGGRSKAVNVYNGLKNVQSVGSIPFLDRLRDRNTSVFLKVASVVPFKGIHVLIEAVRQLSGELKSNCLFVIAGPEPEEYGEYQLFLRKQIAKHGLEESFVFVGWQNDLSPFYNSCDFLIHPSMSTGFLEMGEKRIEIMGNEGLPTCILEAMRNAVPVIATSISGIPEQVENRINGLLVEPNNHQQLAGAIDEMFRSPRQMVDSYKANAQSLFLRRFHVSQFVSSIETLYKELEQ